MTSFTGQTLKYKVKFLSYIDYGCLHLFIYLFSKKVQSKIKIASITFIIELGFALTIVFFSLPLTPCHLMNLLLCSIQKFHYVNPKISVVTHSTKFGHLVCEKHCPSQAARAYRKNKNHWHHLLDESSNEDSRKFSLTNGRRWNTVPYQIYCTVSFKFYSLQDAYSTFEADFSLFILFTEQFSLLKLSGITFLFSQILF